jgi:hypothetical protein
MVLEDSRPRKQQKQLGKVKTQTILTWWLIPLSKWVITPVISGLTLLIPFITGVITHNHDPLPSEYGVI